MLRSNSLLILCATAIIGFAANQMYKFCASPLALSKSNRIRNRSERLSNSDSESGVSVQTNTTFDNQIASGVGALDIVGQHLLDELEHGSYCKTQGHEPTNLHRTISYRHAAIPLGSEISSLSPIVSASGGVDDARKNKLEQQSRKHVVVVQCAARRRKSDEGKHENHENKCPGGGCGTWSESRW
jgi:hypothetical protein